jgi:hypothetical protein
MFKADLETFKEKVNKVDIKDKKQMEEVLEE